MRLLVALGIVALTFLVLATIRLTRHPRRLASPATPAPAETDPRAPPPAHRRASRPPRTAWSGPTLRDLLDEVQAPAAIRGHARGPEGVAIVVRASLAGKRERGRRIRIEDGTFEIPGLLFGRSYDLTFDGPNLRPAILRSVTAPADDVEAKLERLPVLRGAIGFPAGGTCDYREAALRTDDEEPEELVSVGLDETCRFEMTVPDGPSRLVLVATGDRKSVELPVAIPPLGDPEPVCLNPPCRAEPLAGRARLRIGFLGADHADVSATLTFAGDDRSSSYTCFTNGEDCQLDALPVDQAFTLSAEATDCAPATRTITLHAGDNALALDCQARSAEGAIAGVGADGVEDDGADEVEDAVGDRGGSKGEVVVE